LGVCSDDDDDDSNDDAGDNDAVVGIASHELTIAFTTSKICILPNLHKVYVYARLCMNTKLVSYPYQLTTAPLEPSLAVPGYLP